ncbi:MAG: glucose-6-phosphate dehydrogenase [Lactobacillales bacterium]|jgi:glucose-6-phosphate 1-dehydrogenase|nr:glucose-6-phosphate dehydrogenase [Lactobacillales bacterium]
MNEVKATFVIFGASGDLAKRKLYPALFRLYKKGVLGEHFAVIGTARRPWSDEYYQEIARESVKDLTSDFEVVKAFAKHFFYQSHDVQDTEHYVALKKLADAKDSEFGCEGNQMFYLSMSPQFFGVIVGNLKSQNVVNPAGWSRVIVEKPFGYDYATALELNENITSVFEENEIYRIDHYLGKEMIQNINAVRFANGIFEALWNSRHIDNIQITFAESLGVEERGGYYETSGALKDMVQNHLLQVVALLTMDPPATLADEDIRNEKIKALEALKIYTPSEVATNIVRGQYGEGGIDGRRYNSYRAEDNVNPHSDVETFVAGRLSVETARFDGVPIYFRTGKSMTEKGTRINVVFKNSELGLYDSCVVGKYTAPLQPNVLTIYIQPTEGVSITINGKNLEDNLATDIFPLGYRRPEIEIEQAPEAYEKLIQDALYGDSSNFSHWKEVAASWKVVDAIKSAWTDQSVDFPNYQAGTMGPKAAFDLLEQDGNEWVWKPDVWYRERNLIKK